MISKDLAIKYCNNIISGSEEGYIVTNAEMLKQYINQQISDSEVEEAIEKISEYMCCHGAVLSGQRQEIDNILLPKLRKALSDKDREIEQMVDDWNNMYDKKCELQSKLNAIKEVVKESTYGNECDDALCPNEDRLNKIDKILGDEKNE